jgi:hypothetical protein
MQDQQGLSVDQVVEIIGETVEVSTREVFAWQNLLGQAVNTGDRLSVARVQIVLQSLLEQAIGKAGRATGTESGLPDSPDSPPVQ